MMKPARTQYRCYTSWLFIVSNDNVPIESGKIAFLTYLRSNSLVSFVATKDQFSKQKVKVSTVWLRWWTIN